MFPLRKMIPKALSVAKKRFVAESVVGPSCFFTLIYSYFFFQFWLCGQVLLSRGGTVARNEMKPG